MSTKAAFWKGEKGDEYNIRNTITDEKIDYRKLILTEILYYMFITGNSMPETILEVGCGGGANLLAIYDIFRDAPDEVKKPELYGIDINENAVNTARKNLTQATILHGDADKIDLPSNSMQLVITCGFLIHVHPEELNKIMNEINRVSSKYILSMEYFSPESREIYYRGEKNSLWANDFGSKWIDDYKYTCLSYGFAWKRITNLDNLTWWLLKKTN